MKAKAVFLDRDGVLNLDVDFLYKIDDFQWVDEAPEALAYLVKQGYQLFVVTNQSGIARGYYTVDDMQQLHAYMQQELQKYGVQIEKFYYCPHHKEGKIAEYAIDKEQSFLIGDSKRDIEAAQAAGIQGYLFAGGSLLQFVQNIIKG